MRTKLIAAVVMALLASSAFAGSGHDGDEELAVYDTITLNNTVNARACLFFFGFNWVGGESSAAAGNEQYTAWNNGLGLSNEYDPSATISGDALNNAQGNIGVNVVAGAGNNQSNDVALAATDQRDVFASATAISHQDTMYNGEVSSNNNASLSDALQGAKGNIGVNIAAGVGNNQENALAASVDTAKDGGVLVKATTTNDQTTSNNCEVAVNDTASLSNWALSGAQGNIGVNIAAGLGNNQHNGMAIAVATSFK